jgi:hydroxyacylglutathione hydrolase
MKVAIIPVTPFQQNCSLLICEETRLAAVVDPGGDLDIILSEVARLGVTIEKILVTHGHLDHCSGTQDLREQLGVPVEGPHEDDKFWIDGLPQAAAQYGFPPARTFVPDRWLHGGDTVTVGKLTLQVRHCPGHTPGHVVFYEPNAQVAAVGDVLFQGSIGRTDFPRGNFNDLIRSITQELWPLGDDVTFIPGHGPVSTFGEERETNPYVADSVLGNA